MIAKVKGILIFTVVPRPRTVWISTVPPIFSILVFTTSMPTPRPETFVTFSAVENPGTKTRFTASRSLRRLACSVVIRLRSTAFRFTRTRSMPAPSSETSMLTCPPSWDACKNKRPSAALPMDKRVSGVSMPWSTELRTRCVFDCFNNRLVEFGLPAFHFDSHLLAAIEGQIARDARQAVPDIVDGLHAGLHDSFLQLGGDEVESLRSVEETRVAVGDAQLEDLIAGKHQLADQIHEPVELADIDADVAVGDTQRGRRFLFMQRVDQRHWLDGPLFDEDFAKKFRAKYGKEAYLNSDLGYYSVYLFVEALKSPDPVARLKGGLTVSREAQGEPAIKLQSFRGLVVTIGCNCIKAVATRREIAVTSTQCAFTRALSSRLIALN